MTKAQNYVEMMISNGEILDRNGKGKGALQARVQLAGAPCCFDCEVEGRRLKTMLKTTISTGEILDRNGKGKGALRARVQLAATEMLGTIY